MIDLSAIASLGSVVALAIFLILSVAAPGLRHETRSHPAMIGVLGPAAILGQVWTHSSAAGEVRGPRPA